MSALAEREVDYLTRTRRNQRPIAITGAILALVGIAYLTWAIHRYSPLADPRKDSGFDRPVAELGSLFEHALFVVENATPETPTERRLMYGLSRNMQFSSGIMVLQMRIFLGTLTMLGGLIMMTVAVERARLLRLIKRLEEPEHG
ncbi:MAG TPA: hypothetical protein VMR50_19150 [Myxococcota bacterium]|nr:hypothetical protein [Myxococcota bacterium]